MAYKRILVPLLGYGGDRAALTVAAKLASLSDADILALHVKADALAETPLMVDVGVALSELMEAAERHIEKRATTARATFEQFKSKVGGAKLVYKEERGQSAQLIPFYGKVNDLIVIGRPIAEDALAASIMEVEHALFGSGHPVLLVPETLPDTHSLLEKVLVSWNGSVEATHVIGASLPLLKQVGGISVAALGDDGGKEGLPVLIEYLKTHSLNARPIPIEEGEGSVAEKLLRAANQEKVGFILMGAYTHSRLRQLVLGGVTSYMIEKATLPVLMMH